MNKITLMGRLVRDWEGKFVGNDKNTIMGRNALAVDRSYINKDGSRDVDFFELTAWNKLAETLNTYTEKGNRILIEGEMRSNRDEERKTTYWNVNVLGFTFIDSKNTKEDKVEEKIKENTPVEEPTSDERIPF